MSDEPDLEQQLLEAIMEADITRYRLSKLSGVAEGVISRFVNGNRTITIQTAGRLARVLGLELRQVRPSPKAGKGR